MHERTAALEGALVPRRIEPLVRARPDTVRQRFREDNERFRIAVQRLKISVREATPAARIRARPYAWVAGGFATGLVLGLLLTSRRPW
jgi:ElaB/YqjD/DUF883 family membrane-anchored ribosome-binding protein